MATVLLIMLVGFAGFTAYVLWQLVENWRRSTGQDLLTELEGELQELQELAVTKTRLLGQIKDLEFDHQTGHVSVEDYRDMRRRMEAQAIHVLKRLDTLRGEVDYDAVIDDEFERRFGFLPIDAQEAEPAPKKARRKTGPQGDEAPRKDAARPARKKAASKAAASKAASKPAPKAAEPQERRCAACNAALDPDARFCHACGTPVEATNKTQAAVVRPAAAGR